MGCQSSMCTDSSELLLSQPVGGKFSDITIQGSEKSTNHSTNSLPKKEQETPESVRKFYLLRSIIKILLKDLPNFPEISQIVEVWVAEIHRTMEESSMGIEDLKTVVSLDSQGSSLTIKHELDGIRSFDMVRQFFYKIQHCLGTNTFREVDDKSFRSKEGFLVSLCPLTISFYLKLGLEIDFGIGVDKPMDRKQMVQFLVNCAEGANISKWTTLNNQPIPVSCGFSVLSPSRFLNFYIFDGLRIQNIDRGLSLFETFGAPVDKGIGDLFRLSKVDEVNCSIEIDDFSVRGISLQVQSNELGENILSRIDSHTDTMKWNAFHSLLPSKFVAIELNSCGFLLKKISIL